MSSMISNENTAASASGGAINVKKGWIKVRYQMHTKRLSGVPIGDDLDELKIFLWNRFGELRETVTDPGSLIV